MWRSSVAAVAQARRHTLQHASLNKKLGAAQSHHDVKPQRPRPRQRRLGEHVGPTGMCMEQRPWFTTHAGVHDAACLPVMLAPSRARECPQKMQLRREELQLYLQQFVVEGLEAVHSSHKGLQGAHDFHGVLRLSRPHIMQVEVACEGLHAQAFREVEGHNPAMHAQSIDTHASSQHPP